MKRALCLTAFAVSLCFCDYAFAAPVISSSAEAVSVDISIASIVKANASFAPVSGSAGATYDNTANLANINQTASLVSALLSNGLISAAEGLTTGIVKTEAFSATSSATGTANIDNAKFALTTKALNAVPLTSLGLGADVINSTTTAGYNGSGLYASGSSVFTNLGLSGSVLGLLSINGALYSNPAPNTVLLTLPGVTITLNEQQKVQTSSSISMFTNAVDIALSDYALDGQLLNGSIILGHSQASVTGYTPSVAAAAPEPAAWALLIIGFGFIGRAMRRKGRLIAATA